MDLPRGSVTILSALACFSAGGAWAQSPSPAAPAGKMSWTYPCVFKNADGSAMANAPQALQCDYLHVQLQEAADQFNALPSVAAQQEFLNARLPQADAAIAAYTRERDRLLHKTDPTTLSASLKAKERLKDLTQLRTTLAQNATTYCKPFLWPVLDQPSYVLPSATAWQQTWLPCMNPFWQRARQLSGLIAQEQSLVIAAADAGIERRIAQFDAASAGAGPFEGGSATPSPAAATAPPPTAAPRVGTGATSAAPPRLATGARSSLPPPPPPVPAQALQLAQTPQADLQRNYFARGFAAGMERIQDDARISWWHATGETHTIGDPLGKAGLVFHQLGGTCGIASQDEALRARGIDVNMPHLVSESVADGYYSEARKADGSLISSGTPEKDFGAVLKQYGVPVTQSFRTTTLRKATPGATAPPTPPKVTQRDMVAALNRDLQTGGDALVSVRTQPLWQQPQVPASSGHDIYVTGAEVDNQTGKVLGYYIDDTGTDEAARYVPASVFMKAWAGRNDFLVSPQTPAAPAPSAPQPLVAAASL